VVNVVTCAVVVLLLVVGAGLGVRALFWLLIPARSCRHESTQDDATHIQSAAILYMGSEPDAGCPDVRDLVVSGILNKSRPTRDRWGHRFVVECRGDDVRVRSAGPDGLLATADDVHV